jgi:hypothetical protein
MKMVTSIVPGAAGAGALGVDTRYARSVPERRESAPQSANSDRVELSGAALAGARESVRAGIAQVQEALALGHEAMAMLLKVQAVARGEGSQADLDAALSGFAQRLEAAVARGPHLASGDQLAVSAEPGSAPVVIEGVDLSLGGDVVSVPADARADDPALAQGAQRSLEKLQDAMARLLDSVRALEAHQGFLGAVEKAAGVRSDLDADGARLLALQVRQGLESAGSSIANVEPQAVLTLFKA